MLEKFIITIVFGILFITFLVFAAGYYFDRADLYQSWDTKKCVKFVDSDGNEKSCEWFYNQLKNNRELKYNHHWVE